ncbi:hypothetical protein MHBO_002897 [Bonamia ostreae]|uniref:Uncharacterized protein n=1 Tax=Bonamia ostreae TaxID=126728 RepID=A0ABV2ANX7_9EUKA
MDKFRFNVLVQNVYKLVAIFSRMFVPESKYMADFMYNRAIGTIFMQTHSPNAAISSADDRIAKRTWLEQDVIDFIRMIDEYPTRLEN